MSSSQQSKASDTRPSSKSNKSRTTGQTHQSSTKGGPSQKIDVQEPSNNQSGHSKYSQLEDNQKPEQIPLQQISSPQDKYLFDFLLTNGASQFNCFMNSIIQASWNCQSIRDGLLKIQELEQASLPKDGGIIPKFTNTKEFLVVKQLLNQFEQAQDTREALLSSITPKKTVSSKAAPQSRTNNKNTTSQNQTPQGPVEQYKVNEPRLCPDDLRRELFKYYYATDNPEKYDLFKKADAAEFLQSMLELIHFCLNLNQNKKVPDDLCSSIEEKKVQDTCLIHKNMYQKVWWEKQCECNLFKPKRQSLHQNNFTHLIYASEVIDMSQTLLNNHKAQGKRFRKSELEGISGRLMGISKAINNPKENRCISSSDDDSKPSKPCKFNQTTCTHFIAQPFPQDFCVNINWYHNQIPYMDILRVCASIPQNFYLEDLFEVQLEQKDQTSSGQQYILKSVVCFLGAHYMTYVKQRHDQTQGITHPIWKLYDDDKPISVYFSWNEILEKILDFGTLPTVLIYEQVTKFNRDNDTYDEVSNDNLAQLEKRAYELQKFIDQFENNEAQNDRQQKKTKEETKSTQAKSGVVPNPQQNKDLMALTTPQSESQILSALHKQKQKYKNYDIYIFECVQCTLFMMLHQKNCPHCDRKNIYHDESLNVNKQVEDDVSKIIGDFHKQLNMTNQSKQALSEIPMSSPGGASTSGSTKIALGGPEDEDVIEVELESRKQGQSQGSSLKSVRGNKKPMKTPDGELNRTQEFDIDKEEVKVHGAKNTGTVKEPQKNIVTVWKCTECQYLNLFGESQQCGNPRKCNYDLGFAEDLMQLMTEIDEQELIKNQQSYSNGKGKQQEQDFNKGKHVEEEPEKEEEQPLGSDEWICDFCKQRNVMRAGDRTSMNCINPKCGRKNENIEYIVLAMADNRINKEEQMHLDYYNKQKSGQGGANPQKPGQQSQQQQNTSYRQGGPGATRGNSNVKTAGQKGSYSNTNYNQSAVNAQYQQNNNNSAYRPSDYANANNQFSQSLPQPQRNQICERCCQNKQYDDYQKIFRCRDCERNDSMIKQQQQQQLYTNNKTNTQKHTSNKVYDMNQSNQKQQYQSYGAKTIQTSQSSKFQPYQSSVSGANYRQSYDAKSGYQQNNPAANSTQPQAEEGEDEIYERKGDYYQCSKCEKYTVHIQNDKYCYNPGCPSNSDKKFMRDPRNPQQPPAASRRPGGGAVSSTGSKTQQYQQKNTQSSRPTGTARKQCNLCNRQISREDISNYSGKCRDCYVRTKATAGNGSSNINKITVVQGQSKPMQQFQAKQQGVCSKCHQKASLASGSKMCQKCKPYARS